MANKSYSNAPSQVRVPEAQKDLGELGGIGARTNAINPNKLMTPNREAIGTSAMPVPNEGGPAEFSHEMHHGSGKRRG